MPYRPFYSFLLLALTTFACKPSQVPQKVESHSFPYKFSSQIAEELETKTEPWKYQLAAWDYSYIGEYDKTLSTWDLDHPFPIVFDQDKFERFREDYHPVNAIEYILKRADTAQVVIINEAHQQPRHRVFTTELLIQLYEKGYRYLGMETLDKQDGELNKRGYPIYQSGTYSMEPQFGNMIRKALEIGYTLFPYESDGNGTEREIGQARNIETQIQKDPQGKYLIHCGFAHASEGEYKSWGKAMAGRLLEFTGINPLTINQTEFTEKSNKSFENGLYQRLDLAESSVFVTRRGESFKHETHPEWFDMMVFHPRTRKIEGRPDWIFTNGKQQVKIDLSKIDLAFPALVLAYKAGEDEKKAIPVDIKNLGEKQPDVTLALEKGSYRIFIQNQEEQTFVIQQKVK